jgi:hypothetical protein
VRSAADSLGNQRVIDVADVVTGMRSGRVVPSS